MKKVYLLIILFLLSGCSVEYNLEFKDGNLTENIKIGKVEKNAEADLEYLTPYAIYNNVEEDLYDYEYKDQYINLKYTYPNNMFNKSNPFNECYELSNFSYDDEAYYILTSNEFKCLSYAGYKANEVKIKFKTNHNVISTNADYIEGETYTWVINNNNYKNKPINIKLEKNDEIEAETPVDNSNSPLFWLIVGIATVVLVLIGLNIKNKIGRRNEI